ncbi:MAG: aminotransferase class I/II-fold pyridoxal phosphate-dependent enzyme [Microthrixaceae bacterium]|nr:aminotransferase class I/II-fold pyridoxal phosphate-dependent enzyme [Microthrixaceae bacterium]
MGRIHLSPPDVGETEREALLRAFDSNWITPLGPEVDAFEAEICGFTGAHAAAALVSGTAALHLALILAEVGPGDEVWVSDLTFVAPVNAARYVGAELRFIDSEWATWNMDPDLLANELVSAAAADRLPKAVIAVDLYGQCAQLDRIAALCDQYGVCLIEDAAEALGATWQGRSAGTFGRYGAYSFNGNKIMTTGGGGMLVGPAEDMERARYLAAQARKPVLHYEHDEIGYNYRLSNLLAGLGRAQLGRLPAIVDRCHEINGEYRSALGSIEGIDFMPWDGRGRPSGWLTVMTVDTDALASAATPESICAHLAKQEIEARPAWKPMHAQKAFAGVPTIGGAVADQIFQTGVCLPSGSGLSETDQARVIASTLEALDPRSG